MLSKAEFDAVYDKVMEAIREYYNGPVMKKKADVIKFFKERGLDKYLSFPKNALYLGAALRTTKYSSDMIEPGSILKCREQP